MGAERSFKVRDGDLAIVENAGGKGGVGAAGGQHLLYVADAACPARGDHRNGKFLSETEICLHGIAVPGAVVIHRGEKNLSGAEILRLFGP